jgi:uncharacterized protein
MKKAFALIGFLFAATTFAASFDCSKASTPIEKAICSYPELSGLDEQLASAYRAMALTTADQGQLKHEQRTWIAQVRNKCEDTNCLALAYQNRINELAGDVSIQPLLANEEAVSEQPQVIQPEAESPQITTTSEAATQQKAPIPTKNLQETQLPVSERQAMPSKQDATELSNGKPQESGITTLQLKLLGLALLANAMLTIYFHKTNKLIIYRDYTDAAFTGAAPLVSIAIYFLLLFLEVSSDKALIISVCIFAILIFFVAKSTARNNNGLSIFFAMSLITKITIIVLYYAMMAAFLTKPTSSRRKGERYTVYEARKRREATANVVAAAATTATFVALSAWVCKHSEFTPVGDYISPKAIEQA